MFTMKLLKTLQACLLTTVLLLVGCEYEIALSEPMGLPIDNAVLGTWTKLDKHGEVGRNPDQISIYAFSQGQYLVVDIGSNPLYFRAYPILINGLDCVQMKLLVDADELRNPEENTQEKEKLYMVIQYAIEDGNLIVSSLNPELVSRDITSTEELLEAVNAHADDPDLFGAKETYIR